MHSSPICATGRASSPTSEPVARLFLAVRPDPATVERLAQLDRSAATGVRWVPPEQWHITLRFWSDADADDVMGALEGVRLPGADVMLGPIVSRLGRDTVVVPASGVDELAAVVRSATDEVLPREQRPFVGHLTLARLRHRAACGVAGERFTATFSPTSVDLVESVLRPDGARHRTIATWPLVS